MALNMQNMKQQTGNTLGHPTVGVHASRLIGVVDLGVQDRQPWKGTAKSPCGQLVLTFELTDDFVEIDGVKKPRWISKKENAFSGENANLTALVGTLDPTSVHGGDLAAMVRNTLPCLVTVAQKTDRETKRPIEGVRITDIGGVPDNFPVAPAFNAPLVFDWDNPDMVAYDRLPNWVQELIKNAHNYPGSKIEPMIAAYDAQKVLAAAGNQAQAGQGGAPATTTSAPVQTPPPVQNAAPVASQAAVPAAPPGYYWDAASQSFKQGTAPAAQAAQPAAPAKVKVTIPAGYPPGWCIGADGVPVAFDASTMEVDVPAAVPTTASQEAPPGGRPY